MSLSEFDNARVKGIISALVLCILGHWQKCVCSVKIPFQFKIKGLILLLMLIKILQLSEVFEQPSGTEPQMYLPSPCLHICTLNGG